MARPFEEFESFKYVSEEFRALLAAIMTGIEASPASSTMTAASKASMALEDAHALVHLVLTMQAEENASTQPPSRADDGETLTQGGK